jgi:aspartyl-tRNA(Asn)/glutamyl-tRNA(Gln) amidotransferase subunit C
MEKLTKEEVLHVANLARLNVKEEEIEKYSKQLSDILTEIDKITNVDIDDNGEVLIAPISHINVYKEDTKGKMLTKEEMFLNAKNTSGSYIIVPKVLND